MKINLGTIEVDDEMRRAIRSRVGGNGLATRAEVKDLFLRLASLELVDVRFDYLNKMEAEAEANES
mgnify:CR=1 FL=1